MRIRDTRHHVAAAFREHLIANATAIYLFVKRKREREKDAPIYADQDYVFRDAYARLQLSRPKLWERLGDFSFYTRGCESRTKHNFPKLPRSLCNASDKMSLRIVAQAKSCSRQTLGPSVSKIRRRFRDRLLIARFLRFDYSSRNLKLPSKLFEARFRRVFALVH